MGTWVDVWDLVTGIFTPVLFLGGVIGLLYLLAWLEPQRDVGSAASRRSETVTGTVADSPGESQTVGSAGAQMITGHLRSRCAPSQLNRHVRKG